jgi:hypothetical protein
MVAGKAVPPFFQPYVAFDPDRKHKEQVRRNKSEHFFTLYITLSPNFSKFRRE